MSEQTNPERHNVNISRQVWGELKLRSFQEGMSASDLVAYVLEQFAREQYNALKLPRYQPRSPDEDRIGRTVFLPAGLWPRVQEKASQSGTSISHLIEYLLKRYLGLLPESETADEPEEPKVVRIGEERVYLGENPIKIDLKTGKPKEE